MTSNDIDVSAVVIDSGSGYCKAGLAGEDAPKTCFPSLTGAARMTGLMISMDSKDIFVGDEAYEKRGTLNINHPIKHGIIDDWDGIEKIWHHCYYDQLRVPPEEHPCLLSESPLNTRENRAKMTELMFDYFNVPNLFISSQAVLALYASGRTTGVVVDSGDGITHTVPIYEGYSLPHSICEIELAGDDLTNFMLKLLNELGYTFSAAKQKESVREIKEKVCYVAEKFDGELKYSQDSSAKDVTYELPDGNSVCIGAQQFICPEALFQPSKIGKDCQGIQDMLFQSIMSSDVDIRPELFKNIVLSGGSTLFKGLDIRLKNEIAPMAPQSIPKDDIRIVASAERKFATWIGGSILSSLSTFQAMWMNKAEFDEYGSDISYRKCF